MKLNTIKYKRLEALKELKKEFEANNNKSIFTLSSIYKLIDMDFIPNDMDVYEVNNSNYSKSIIDGWTSHTEQTKYYTFYGELIKEVNNKIVSEWVKIEHDKKDLLIKLYDILEGLTLNQRRKEK